MKHIDTELNTNNKLSVKNYRTWGKGAGAELKVINQLERLPAEYKVINDYQTGHGNIDSVVIGPKGVFVIEVKSIEGYIKLENDTLYKGDLMMEENNYIAQTLAEALTVRGLIKNQFNMDIFVTGILEFPNSKNTYKSIVKSSNNIWVGGSNYHETVIANAKGYLNENEVNDIYTYLLDQKGVSNGSDR